MLFSRWLARTTKRTLCSPTSTVPHAILPSHEGPSPPPSPRRSVKDVLTTPRKGCHETQHWNGCATGKHARCAHVDGYALPFKRPFALECRIRGMSNPLGKHNS